MIRIADRIRDSKAKMVYEFIRYHGTASKQDLLQWSGMTPSTMVRMLEDLLENELIQEIGYGESTGGRRPILYQIYAKYAYVFGLEISRSISKLILFDLHLNVLDSSMWMMTEEMTPEKLTNQVSIAMKRMMHSHGLYIEHILGLGIGSVGPLNRKQGIILDPPHFYSKGWENVPICGWFEKEFGLQVNIDNGANASLLGEYWTDRTKNHEHLLYLHTGIGIRSAIMTGGKMVYGAVELEGSIGQMIIQADGRAPVKAKQNHGCLEAFTSILALEQRAQSMLKLGRSSVLFDMAHEIEQVRFSHLLQALKEKDPMVEEIFVEAATYFGIGIANVLNIVHPQKVILGGPLICTNDHFYEIAEQVARKKTYYSPRYNPVFEKAKLGEDSIAYGAALMMIDQLGH